MPASSQSHSQRRVVITGLGLVSPLGNSPVELWESLSARRSGVGFLSRIPSLTMQTPFAAEAKNFTETIGDFGNPGSKAKRAIKKGLKLMCRETQMAVAAAQKAMEHAGLAGGGFDNERMGVILGSDYMVTNPEDFAAAVAKCAEQEGNAVKEGTFRYEDWGQIGLGDMSPLWLLKYLPNMPASHIAIFNDLRGPNNSVTVREAASNVAIGEAFHTIRRGHADCIVSGATGTRVHPTKTTHAIFQEQLANTTLPPKRQAGRSISTGLGWSLGKEPAW